MSEIIHYIDQALAQEGKPHHTNRGMQYSYQCPMCNDYKSRFFINTDRKVCYCHNCEYKGTIITFLSDVQGIAWRDALSLYREYDGYEIQLPESLEQEIYERLISAPNIEVPKVVHPLPEEFILIEDARGKIGQKAIKYLKGRGVTLDMAEKYYIGYCEEGKYANRIIMPDFEDGELVYWQARTMDKAPNNKMAKKYFRKVLNPSLDEDDIKSGLRAVDKSEVVSNIDLIKEERMAVIVEGKFDAYTLGDVGACIHGKSMSDTQFMKLVKNQDHIDVVSVMLDGDAFDKAVSTADRLYRYFDNVLVCRLPKDADPNGLGRRKVLEILNDAIPYSPMFGVKARLKGWI